ncbi:M3 family oligoendopeptidase [Bacteroidota bacterium]
MKLAQKHKRAFLSDNFKVTDWESLKPYFEELVGRDIDSVEALQNWLLDRSELESIVAEDAGWRYIRMTCDTTNNEYIEQYQYFIREIEPETAPYANELNKKVLDSPYVRELIDPAYTILLRGLEKEIRIYRKENIPIKTEIQSESQKFGSISGAMTIEWENQELTLQQAGVFLQSTERDIREKIYKKTSARRFQDKDKLNDLYTNLIELRNKIAKNADFDNFRDYMFTALGRFDYTPEDCFTFHDAVNKELTPVLNEMAQERKSQLGIANLRPWDKAVDAQNLPPLKPFDGGNDLLAKTIHCFEEIDNSLGEYLEIMKEMGHLDLESRKGKAPGGYNFPLAETGVPFIFMNATSTLRDMVTILHEGGHAVHSFVTKDLTLIDFRNPTSEVAELASMSMELISMDNWQVYFSNMDELNRAKRQHLEQIFETLPWVATIDKFQHWIYENPGHSLKDREINWLRIFEEFSDRITDWTGLENHKSNIWQKQLHLYEVPFYYIEYGIAQLGAIAIWKKYNENPEKGLKAYLDALKLGYTRTIPEIYRTADIEFNFSHDYIHELMIFLRSEWEKVR